MIKETKKWQAKHTRLVLVGVALLCAGLAAALVLIGLSRNVTYFYAPSDIVQQQEKLLTEKRSIRLGGMVETGSVVRDGLHLRFQVTDYTHVIHVDYEGLPPELFREGQGVVAEGMLVDNKNFKAHTLLAKHDETYMPPEVAKALKKNEKNDKQE